MFQNFSNNEKIIENMHLQDFPPEILVTIMYHMSLSDLLTFSQVSKYFHILVNTELSAGKIPICLQLIKDNNNNENVDHIKKLMLRFPNLQRDSSFPWPLTKYCISIYKIYQGWVLYIHTGSHCYPLY